MLFILFLDIFSLEKSMKIVFIIGSLRRKSFNRSLAERAAGFIGDRAEISFLEYADIPYMNQDIEHPAPEAVQKVRDEIMSADGLWIFSPEYNFSIPGVLKNLLDWLSRPLMPADPQRITAVTDMPVTFSGVGGRMATANARKRLSELAIFMKMRQMPGEEAGISLPAEAFASDSYTLSAEEEQKLRNQAEGFLEFIKR